MSRYFFSAVAAALLGLTVGAQSPDAMERSFIAQLQASEARGSAEQARLLRQYLEAIELAEQVYRKRKDLDGLLALKDQRDALEANPLEWPPPPSELATDLSAYRERLHTEAMEARRKQRATHVALYEAYADWMRKRLERLRERRGDEHPDVGQLSQRLVDLLRERSGAGQGALGDLAAVLRVVPDGSFDSLHELPTVLPGYGVLTEDAVVVQPGGDRPKLRVVHEREIPEGWAVEIEIRKASAVALFQLFDHGQSIYVLLDKDSDDWVTYRFEVYEGQVFAYENGHTARLRQWDPSHKKGGKIEDNRPSFSTERLLVGFTNREGKPVEVRRVEFQPYR